MGLFGMMRLSGEAMSVHLQRSEIAAENLANAYTPGYKRKVVEIGETAFSDSLQQAGAGRAMGGPSTFQARNGVVEIKAIRRVNSTPGESADMFADTTIAMASKSAFEVSARMEGIAKSLATASLEIGRG